jgi:hypothetical protein
MTDPRLLEELSFHVDPVWSWVFVAAVAAGRLLGGLAQMLGRGNAHENRLGLDLCLELDLGCFRP